MPKSKAPPRKRHHTERYRPPASPMKERWTRSQAALAGFMYGQHRSSVDIAAALGPDIIPATVRAMISRRWKLPKNTIGTVIEIPRHQHKKLAKLAAEKGMTPERYLARICFISIRDDMYDAIVPRDDKG